MKAFLLAAGHGTRLRPLTDRTPKCLLPIRGTPILRLWIDACRACGIDELLINIHSHADAVRRFVKTGFSDLRITIAEEPMLLGSAGTLRANREWVQSEPFFWIFYADVLTNADLASMLQFHRRNGQIATLGVYQVPDPARCGVVSVDHRGIICEFIEKPARPKSNLAFSGLMLASPPILDYIPECVPVDIGFHVLPRLVGRMAAYRISEYLVDVGTLDNYYHAQQSWPGAVRSEREC